MRAYIQDVLGIPASGYQGPRGSAASIYSNYSTRTTLSSGSHRIRLDKINNTPTGVPQKGDIIFWNSHAGGGYGHVAIYLEGNVSGSSSDYFYSLDQNWRPSSPTRGSAANRFRHSFRNVSGWLRPVLISH